MSTLRYLYLYDAAQFAALGLNGPSSDTSEADIIFYGCTYPPFGNGDDLVVHGVGYKPFYTNDVLVLHSLLLLSNIRVVENTLQFQNGHTYPLEPFVSAHMIGLRYDADQFSRVKTLRITDGEPMPRGENVEAWPVDPPVDLGTRPSPLVHSPQGYDGPSSSLVSIMRNSNIGSTATAGTILRR